MRENNTPPPEEYISPELQWARDNLQKLDAIWIIRSDGSVQKGVIAQMLDVRRVRVSFVDAEGKKKQKDVSLTDLRGWQSLATVEIPLAEPVEQAVVRRNVIRMRSNKEGGMMRLLGNESHGGNAPVIDGSPAAYLHFYVQPTTGLFNYFAVPQNTPEEIKTVSLHGGLFVRINTLSEISDHIVRYELDDPTMLTPAARRVLDTSIETYNGL